MIAGDLLGERARLTPEKLALVTVPGGERLSYAELDRRSWGCARLLTERLGLAPGDRFGLLAGNRAEYLEAFFACGKTGVTIVPLGTRLTAAEIAHVVADSGLTVLLHSAEFHDRVAELAGLGVCPRTVDLDGDYAAWRGELAEPAPTSFRADPEHLWALLYTSGTTGRPKGVKVPHRQVLWNGYNTVVGWGLRPEDVSPIFTPLYHAGGLGAFLVPIVTTGGTIVLHEGFDPAEIWRTIERERATVVLGVPTIWERLSEVPEFASVDLSAVRFLISGGAPLPRFLIDRYQARGVGFKQGYGLTEVGVNCFTMTLEESVRKAGSIGKPLPFTAARLVDTEGREVAVDEVGELWLRGPHVCRGYWRQPEATAAVLDDDGFFHTGDLARRDAEGFFTIAGRAKDMLISGGVNVYPAEIEGVLVLHPGIRDAAVVGVPDDRWGEAGVAFLVGAPGPVPEAELQAHLNERLARYKHPKAVVWVAELPRTAYGKVVKGQLRDRWLNREEGTF
ncbi:MAG: AMP-binding protein [Thermoanaerobaculia bacterium]|nr:AMP-binding protein [Thermoanaerobaculia bacterium]